MRLTRREALYLAGVGAVAMVPMPSAASADKVQVRTAVNPILFGFLPIILGAENGDFAAEGIDLVVSKFTSSSVTQMPRVARGDLDVTQISAGPPLFNQRSQGFDIKVLCSTIEAHPGWPDNLCVIVRKDLWDSGTIRKITDLRGRRVDGATSGSPTNYLTNQTILKAGLTRADVVYSERLRTPPDTFAALQNKAVDVVASVEPEATAIVDHGLGVRLVTSADIIPDLQNGFLVASAAYIQQNRRAVVSFLKVYLREARLILDHGPRFSPDVLRVIGAWTKLPSEELEHLGAPYFGQFGSINVAALQRQQAYWRAQGLVPDDVDVEAMVDGSMVAEARSELGIK
jgi:ABC-type nitrate/sulfonate/bicarbonate transport system substrate-binding protein